MVVAANNRALVNIRMQRFGDAEADCNMVRDWCLTFFLAYSLNFFCSAWAILVMLKWARESKCCQIILTWDGSYVDTIIL